MSKAGYIKRTSPRSCRDPLPVIKRGDDRLIFVQPPQLQHLLIITTLWECLSINELADIRWKDIGEHLSHKRDYKL